MLHPGWRFRRCYASFQCWVCRGWLRGRESLTLSTAIWALSQLKVNLESEGKRLLNSYSSWKSCERSTCWRHLLLDRADWELDQTFPNVERYQRLLREGESDRCHYLPDNFRRSPSGSHHLQPLEISSAVPANTPYYLLHRFCVDPRGWEIQRDSSLGQDCAGPRAVLHQVLII